MAHNLWAMNHDCRSCSAKLLNDTKADYAMELFNDTQSAEYDAKVQQEIIDFMKRNGYECKKISQWALIEFKIYAAKIWCWNLRNINIINA